jgi:hypothetical protein
MWSFDMKSNRIFISSEISGKKENNYFLNYKTVLGQFLREKFITAIIILLIPVMLASVSCGTSGMKHNSSEDISTGNWMDDDTFRITSTGVSNKKLTNITQMKYSSRRDALQNARYKIKEIFKSQKKYEMKQAGFDPEDFDPQIKALIAGVQAAVRSGSIIKEIYDEKNDCTLIYEVNYRDMKKIVKSYRIYD